MRIRQTIWLSATIIAILFFSSCSSDPRETMETKIAEGNYSEAVKLYNRRIAGTEYEKEYNDIFTEKIDEIVAGWAEESLEYCVAANMLDAISKIDNDEISAEAMSGYKLIEIENTGNDCLAEAEKAYAQDDLAEAMKQVKKINKSYSQYDSVEELYKTCQDIVLSVVEEPFSSSECIEYIDMLDTYIENDENEKFIERREELEGEVLTFEKIEKRISHISSLYDGGNAKKSFTLLDALQNDYPKNNLVELYVKTLHDSFVISTTQEALTLSEKKEYKEALDLVQEANDILPCDDFIHLIDSIKRQKSILYRIKSSIVDKFMTFTHNSKGEKLSVKDMGNKAGAYVIASGKKLVLGDYTNDEVTVLSFSGDILASLSGVDFLMDLRDLSYDVVNWGEDDYFMVKIATDTVALLPVIGLIKYIDTKSATKAIKKIANSSDGISDMTKNVSRIAETANAITKNHKKYETLGDALDQIHKESKLNVVKGRHVRYVKINTINQIHKGEVYKGVPYKEVKVKCSNGRFKGVFPQFEYVYQTTLPKSLLKESNNTQFKYCNEDLLKAVKANNKLRESFTPDQLEEIENGVISNAPAGWTWHHNENEGIMQLVNAETHKMARHTGGNSIWGYSSIKEVA